MKLNRLEISMDEITQFCQKWKLTELVLFGSVLRDDFCPERSDVDVMIQYAADACQRFTTSTAWKQN